MPDLKYKKILVISDNPPLMTAFKTIAAGIPGLLADFACTPGNYTFVSKALPDMPVFGMDVKKEYESIIAKYDLVFSVHCKQLFPAELVNKVKCMNIHPGYNPYNRGWFPQVFSILNKLPVGATIHEIDEKLDHGAIIARKEVPTHSWETSLDIYNKVQLAEIELLKEHLESILQNNYQTTLPEQEGNVNLKKDFNALCKLDMNETITMGAAIDKLRALTHGSYANAFYMDPETGAKVYVKVVLEKKE